jgi:hypothetical protein
MSRLLQKSCPRILPKISRDVSSMINIPREVKWLSVPISELVRPLVR